MSDHQHPQQPGQQSGWPQQSGQQSADHDRFRPRDGQGQAPSEASSALSPAEPEDQGHPDSEDLGPEAPHLRAQRLHRRRRHLLIGAVPALLAVIVAAWAGTVFGLSMAASHALTKGDHQTAVARYRTVAGLNPWLEQWRVHYNLGTALLVGGDLEGAQGALELALSEVPVSRETDPQTGLKPATAPECRVRHNLALAHLAKASAAQDQGDTAAAEESTTAAQEAIGQCPPPQPPSQDPSQDPSQNPSATPSQDPSASPSQDPSQDPSATPSQDPSSSASQDPSQDPSATPSQDSSQDPSATPSQDPSQEPSGTPSSSQEPSASASASEDDRADRLRRRNNDEPQGGATPKDKGQGPGKPW